MTTTAISMAYNGCTVVACPTCRAAVGAYCLSPRKRRDRAMPHALRVRAYCDLRGVIRRKRVESRIPRPGVEALKVLLLRIEDANVEENLRLESRYAIGVRDALRWAVGVRSSRDFFKLVEALP